MVFPRYLYLQTKSKKFQKGIKFGATKAQSNNCFFYGAYQFLDNLNLF